MVIVGGGSGIGVATAREVPLAGSRLTGNGSVGSSPTPGTIIRRYKHVARNPTLRRKQLRRFSGGSDKR